MRDPEKIKISAEIQAEDAWCLVMRRYLIPYPNPVHPVFPVEVFSEPL